MIRLITLVSALTLTSFSAAEPILKGNPDELREFLDPVEHTVTLNATHDETAFSDKAIVSLVITTEASQLENSMRANAALRNTITQTLIDAGVGKDEINTSKFSSSPQFGWFGSKPKSFEVVNRMSVGITDEAHLQLIAALTDDNDEVVLAGMKFEHTEKEAFENKVRANAMDKALARKAVLEERLGFVLVPIGFNEQIATPYETRGYAELDRARSPAQFSANSVAGGVIQTQPTFDEITYRATVFVTFGILRE